MRHPPRTPSSQHERRDGPDGIVLELTRKGGDGFYDVIYTMDIILGNPGKTYPMLVDTGSSDTWVASSNCPSCRSAPAIYDPASTSTSIQSSQTFSYNYLSGSVTGSIYWEQVSIGTYAVLHQAIVAATSVANEALELGFSGIIGLALPPLSNVSSILGTGSGGGSQDGATIFSNLFGLPSPQGPSRRFFSLLLSRPGFNSRETSANAWPARMGIGAHVEEVMHAFPDGDFESNIQWATMTSTGLGYTHWRTRMTAVTVYKDGAVLEVQMPRGGDGGMQPIAALDTGGSTMLASRRICDAIYGSWGVSISEDGKYYVPCRQPLNITITLSTGSPIPIHPLDMSSYINNDRASNPATCVGSLQANDLLGNRNSPADIVLGAPFLRNVYTIHALESPNEPGQGGTSTDGPVPRIGLIPVTDIPLALHEFDNVRNLGLAPDGSRSQTGVDPEDTKRSMGMLGKIMLGVGLFAALCILLFGIRWVVLSRRMKARQRRGLPSEEGFPMREWAETIKRRVTRRGAEITEFGVPEGIAGDVATQSALGHGNLSRHVTTKSTQRQGSGPFAGFSFLTFIGARRLGFGGGYQRTPNPEDAPDGQPTEDEIRRQKFEEYKRKQTEEAQWGKRNRANEASVWSDVTWIDKGDGTLTPVGATTGLVPGTPNETVVGSTTHLNAYGFPKGGSTHGDNVSDDGSTERGSTLHGSPVLEGKLGVGTMGARRLSNNGGSGPGIRESVYEHSSLIPPAVGGLSGGRPPHATHRSIPSLELNRTLREDSIPITASPFDINSSSEVGQPLRNDSFNPYDIPVTVQAPPTISIPDYPHRTRPPLAMEPTLSPLTEVNSSELPPSTSGEYNTAIRPPRGSNVLHGPAGGALNPTDGLERQGSVSSIGGMSISSDILVPLPISLMALPPSLYSSTPMEHPSSSVIRISDSPPPQANRYTVSTNQRPPPPPEATAVHALPPAQNLPVLLPEPASLPLQPEPARPGPSSVPAAQNRKPFDPLGLETLAFNDSRFPVFAPSSSQATPRPTYIGTNSPSISRPASMANLGAEVTPRPTTTALTLPRPYSELHLASSSSLPSGHSIPPSLSDTRLAQRAHEVHLPPPSHARVDSHGDRPLAVDDFVPPFDPAFPRAHYTLSTANPQSRPLPASRSSEPIVSSLGPRSRGPRPMVRGSASAADVNDAPFSDQRQAAHYDSPVSLGSDGSGTPNSARAATSSSGSLETASPRIARGPRAPTSRSSQESGNSQSATRVRHVEATSPPRGPTQSPELVRIMDERNALTRERVDSTRVLSEEAHQPSAGWREEAAQTAGMAGVGARSRFTGDSLPTFKDPSLDRR